MDYLGSVTMTKTMEIHFILEMMEKASFLRDGNTFIICNIIHTLSNN